MSYSVNLWGHDAAVDDLKEAFEDFVRGLRTIGQGDVGGSLTGTEGGQAFAFQAADVVNLEAADAGDDGDETAATTADASTPTDATNG